MSYDFIVPIESHEEAKNYIRKMYCKNCKEQGGCYPVHNFPIIENGYHYDVVSCECSKCSESFDMKFFNQNSYPNFILKENKNKYNSNKQSKDSNTKIYLHNKY